MGSPCMSHRSFMGSIGPEMVEELASMPAKIRSDGRSRPLRQSR